MQDTLAGRKALISGGASGIGRAAAAHLQALGCEVMVTDLDPPGLPGVGYRRADLRVQAQVDALYEVVRAELGAPDLLICSAGLGVQETLAEGDPSKWAQVLEVNVLGAMRLLRAFVPGMLEAGGDVVVIGSVAAGRAYPGGGPYAASKAALERIAETLRLEVQPAVRVTTLSPGVVDTPFFGRMLAGNQSVEDIGFGSIRPEQIAELIAYAVSRPDNLALDHLIVRPRGQPF